MESEVNLDTFSLQEPMVGLQDGCGSDSDAKTMGVVLGFTSYCDQRKKR